MRKKRAPINQYDKKEKHRGDADFLGTVTHNSYRLMIQSSLQFDLPG